MQNLAVTSNVSCFLDLDGFNFIDIALDFSSESILVLSSIGLIKRLPFDSFANEAFSDLVCIVDDTVNDTWFRIDYVEEISSIVCISHSGSISRVDEQSCEQEGVIEGGISAAKWSPDYRCLVIVTKNNSILSMTSSWDVLQEVGHCEYDMFPRLLISQH
jgi:hypothetical protein